jgi:hypothetical protein
MVGLPLGRLRREPLAKTSRPCRFTPEFHAHLAKPFDGNSKRTSALGSYRNRAHRRRRDHRVLPSALGAGPLPFHVHAALSLRFTVLLLFPACIDNLRCRARLWHRGLDAGPGGPPGRLSRWPLFLPTFASWAVPGVWALGDHKWRRRDGGMQSAK